MRPFGSPVCNPACLWNGGFQALSPLWWWGFCLQVTHSQVGGRTGHGAAGRTAQTSVALSVVELSVMFVSIPCTMSRSVVDKLRWGDRSVIYCSPPTKVAETSYFNHLHGWQPLMTLTAPCCSPVGAQRGLCAGRTELCNRFPTDCSLTPQLGLFSTRWNLEKGF